MEVDDDFEYTASIAVPAPLIRATGVGMIMAIAVSVIRRIPPVVIPAWVSRRVATVRNVVPRISAVRMSDGDIVAHGECLAVGSTQRRNTGYRRKQNGRCSNYSVSCERSRMRTVQV